MKKLVYLIVLALILSLVLVGCGLLSNVGQAPTTEQSGITYLTKNSSPPVLVGLWHFDDDALDSSGNNNDGTVYGGESWVDGKFGNALSFDGVNNWVDIPDLSITGDFSIEFWVNLDPGISNHDAIVGPGVPVAQDINFHAGHCRWFTGDDSGFPRDVIIANTPAQPNTWEYYAITRSGDTLTLYLNGVVDVTKDVYDINTFPFHPMVIGRGNAGYFGGLIDEVRIWDGALTGPQIAQSYALGTTQPEATVVELGQEFFGDEVVIFTSSFHGLNATCPNNLDTIEIYMMSNYGDAIEDVSARKKLFTPNNTSGCTDMEESINEETSTSVEVGKYDCESIHLSLDLTSGRSVGFNAQFLPYD
jgi:hypothetical protein